MRITQPHVPPRRTAQPRALATESSIFPPWFPSDPDDRMHILMLSIHTAGAIGAYIMSMYCDVLRANQQAMIPRAVAPTGSNTSTILPTHISQALLFRAGFPWSQDAKFETHVWNPYLLIVAFEWLTATFAFCTIQCWRDKARDWVNVWTVLGSAAILLWFMRHYVFRKTDGAVFPWAMAFLVPLSFAAAVMICYNYLTKCEAFDADPLDKPEHASPAPEEDSLTPHEKTDSQGKNVRRTVIQGRTWNVPTTVDVLKPRPIAAQAVQGKRPTKGLADDGYTPIEDRDALRRFTIAAYDVGFRYAEYCITAPLLFLAVLALLTVDAPAWLYLTGYWLIQACNVIGLAYHATICSDLLRDGLRAMDKGSPPIEPTTVTEWMRALIANGSWCVLITTKTHTCHPPKLTNMRDRYDRGMQHAYLLESSWLCLLIPIGGLIYMVRSWILSTEVPWIASLMIWLLLVMYCSFGVVPSLIYATYRRDLIQKLPWVLDILNVAAKFPIPILVLIAFTTRPNGFHVC